MIENTVRCTCDVCFREAKPDDLQESDQYKFGVTFKSKMCLPFALGQNQVWADLCQECTNRINYLIESLDTRPKTERGDTRMTKLKKLGGTEWEKQGGAAFPCEGSGAHHLLSPDPGMSMLDWFAGMALTGLMRGKPYLSPEHVAVDAYMLAEAMLEQRNARLQKDK